MGWYPHACLQHLWWYKPMSHCIQLVKLSMEIASVTYHISTLLHLSPTVEWWFIPQDLSSTPATRSSGTMACFRRRQTARSSSTTWRYYELTNSVWPADKRWSWRNAQRHSTGKDAAGNAPVDTLHHQELEACSNVAYSEFVKIMSSFAEGKSVMISIQS